MPLRRDDHAVPLVAGQRDELREVGERLGRDADVDLAARRLLGHLHRIALVQHDLDLGVARRELAQHLRQHVARLRVRGGDRQRAGVLAAEFVGDALQVRDLAHRAPRGRDDDLAGGRERRQPLALAHEHRQAELVLELADLLADARLRREQRFGGVGHVEAVVDDRAEVLELLQVHSVITRMTSFCDNYISERRRSTRPDGAVLHRPSRPIRSRASCARPRRSCATAA